MIIVMRPGADEADIRTVVDLIRARGLSEHISRGAERTIIGAVGDERVFEPQEIMALRGVEKAMRVLHNWRIISRETQARTSHIRVRGLVFGDTMQLIRPLSADAITTANVPQALFADPFFLPGTPYSEAARQGEHSRIRQMQADVRRAHEAGCAVLLRIRDVRQIEAALQAQADVLYLGGELMTNRALQEEVGRLNTPLVLCKDKHHQVDDWLTAAEHIALKGNHHIMLGEAGTLSLTQHAPYRLDVDAICQAKQLSHLPVLANILRLSHTHMPAAVLQALASAAGADAVIVPACLPQP